MNPRLGRLQPYPFERLRALLSGVTLPPLPPIRLSIGEPQHATPELLTSALTGSLAGLSAYPRPPVSTHCARRWRPGCMRRFGLPRLDPATQVLPVSGTREALFAIAQAVVDTSRRSPSW
jgi:N-succinyldiaminopimelate aminotransferase